MATQPNITVIVIDSRRNPVEGAIVLVVKDKRDPLSGVTNREGRVIFQGMCIQYEDALVVVVKNSRAYNGCIIDTNSCGCEVTI